MNIPEIREQLLCQRGITCSGCWEYFGTCTTGGYGEIRIDGEIWRVHRLMYTLENGPIPDGMEIMHSCDNPPCFNPDHLSAGTHHDNMADMARKGRQGRRYDNVWRTTCSATPWQCVNGHDMTDPANVYVNPRKSRKCRTCKNEAHARFAARQKAARFGHNPEVNK